MKNLVFLFTGIILIIVAVIVFQSNASIKINGQIAQAETSVKVKSYVSAGLGALGLVFVIVGIIGVVRASKQRKRNLFILKNGIETQGKVTFVDKNYRILVNKTPIYSIVEYTYQDKSGNHYTRKINNISSEIVIRKQIQVNSNITVKYAADNPSESVMVI